MPPQLMPIVFLVNQPPKGIDVGWITFGLRCCRCVQQAQLLCHHSAHDLIAELGEMNAVEGQPAALPRRPLGRRGKQVHGVNTKLRGDLENRLRVFPQSRVPGRDIHHCRRDLLRDGSHKHYLWRRVAVEIFGTELPHKTLHHVSKMPHLFTATK